ncbi:MAG: hypothetical protein ABII19_00485 [Patescibacteria group bacterium]
MKNPETSFPDIDEVGVIDRISDEKRTYDESLEEGKEELSREVIVEGRKRLRVVVELDKLFDQLDAAKNFDTRKTITDKIEDFLDKNESIIARSDKSGVEEVRYYRRRLDKFRAETERVAA